jgi:hypothetical protein
MEVSTSNTLSGFAVLISLIALGFTGLQWRESHNQLLLSMKPSVDFETQNDADEPPVGITIQNAGPEPAIIKSVTYFVDKKPVGDLEKLVDFASLQTFQGYEFDEGDTLAVGEHHWLVSIRDKPRGKSDEKVFDNFIDLIDHHLAVKVEFCPALPGECSTKCSTKDWCK